tara:strand:+ start:50 stop:355 length:306 start_codon:yes stop_codon:yes gene_type:complete
MANAQYIFSQVNTGTGEETTDLSHQYTNTQISISGLSSGTLTVRARGKGSDSLEAVIDGTIDLSSTRTLVIPNVSIDLIGLSVTPAAAYTVNIRQTDKRFS